jgi:hypothetical protein
MEYSRKELEHIGMGSKVGMPLGKSTQWIIPKSKFSPTSELSFTNTNLIRNYGHF